MDVEQLTSKSRNKEIDQINSNLEDRASAQSIFHGRIVDWVRESWEIYLKEETSTSFALYVQRLEEMRSFIVRSQQSKPVVDENPSPEREDHDDLVDKSIQNFQIDEGTELWFNPYDFIKWIISNISQTIDSRELRHLEVSFALIIEILRTWELREKQCMISDELFPAHVLKDLYAREQSVIRKSILDFLCEILNIYNNEQYDMQLVPTVLDIVPLEQIHHDITNGVCVVCIREYANYLCELAKRGFPDREMKVGVVSTCLFMLGLQEEHFRGIEAQLMELRRIPLEEMWNVWTSVVWTLSRLFKPDISEGVDLAQEFAGMIHESGRIREWMNGETEDVYSITANEYALPRGLCCLIGNMAIERCVMPDYDYSKLLEQVEYHASGVVQQHALFALTNMLLNRDKQSGTDVITNERLYQIIADLLRISENCPYRVFSDLVDDVPMLIKKEMDERFYRDLVEENELFRHLMNMCMDDIVITNTTMFGDIMELINKIFGVAQKEEWMDVCIAEFHKWGLEELEERAHETEDEVIAERVSSWLRELEAYERAN